MAEQKTRPVPKRRSATSGNSFSANINSGANEPFQTSDLYGPRDAQMLASTEFAPDANGLPSCVRLKHQNVSETQKKCDSQLPGFLHELDEACKKCSSDAEKIKLAMMCVQAASSPIRKYRILQFFELLQDNKDNIDKLPGALSILEKYAINLLRDERPLKWKEIKYSASIIQNMVFPIQGATDVLKIMGYSEVTGNAMTFPLDVDEPDLPRIIVLAADLSIARCEADALMFDRHPFLIFDPAAPLVPTLATPSSGEGMTDGADTGAYVGGFCGVCSEQNLATTCTECDMQFCEECDERWHFHKLRRSHIRTSLKRKKVDEERPRPRPVPRPRHRNTQHAEHPNSQTIQERTNYNPSTDQEIKRPGNMMSPSNMTPPNNMTPPGNMMLPGNMMSPNNRRNMAVASNVNFHVNPSQQPQIFTNPTYSMKIGKNSSGAQDFNQSREQDFGQSGGRGQFSNQSSRRTLHRVFSCPNCSFLCQSSQDMCPSCNTLLSPDPQNSPRSPLSPKQSQGVDLHNAASRLPASPAGRPLAGQQTLLKDLAYTKDLANRSLPEPPRAPGVATRVSHVNNADAMYEEVDQLLEWGCEHCTFVNPLTTKVCQACFKTPSDLKKYPNLLQKQAVSKANEVPVRPQASSREPTGSYGAHQDRGAVYMTPKDRPLEGGIFVSPPQANAPPLPAKKKLDEGVSPGGKVVDAQKHREQELTEKEKGKMFDDRKQELAKQGMIRADEVYSIQDRDELNCLVEDRKRAGYLASSARSGNLGPLVANLGSGLSEEELWQLVQAGVLTQQDLINNGVLGQANAEPRTSPARTGNEMLNEVLLTMTPGDPRVITQARPGNTAPPFGVPATKQPEASSGNNEDFALSDEQLEQLLREGMFEEKSPSTTGSKLTEEELNQLYQAGIISLEYLQNIQHDPQPIYDAPRGNQPAVNTDEIESMFTEFMTLQTSERPGTRTGTGELFKNRTLHNFNVTRDPPVVQGLYDKRSSPFYSSLPSKPSAPPTHNFSSFLNSQNPQEEVTERNFIDDQSKIYVEWMKQAEKFGFTPEELNLANNLNWQDAEGRSPVQWLKDEWTARVVEVIGKVTERTSNENDRIGNLSTDEAKQALLENHGSVESACKVCIESRREKLTKIGEISVFSRADCLSALDRNNGNLEQALLELEKKAMEPIRNRVLALQDLEDGRARSASGVLERFYEDVVRNKDVSFERRVRVVFAEKNMRSWGRAETVIRLVDMGFAVDDSIEAAEAYGDLKRSLSYLEQECPICTDKLPMGQMITFLSCQCKFCKNCVGLYLTSRIKDMQIHTTVCPQCSKPDLRDEVAAADYFNNLDVIIRELVAPEVHDLFQKKLRDRALSKEENFRWCAHCSCGFINEQPNINKMQCPNCRNFTCFSCKKPWEDQHEGISCEQFEQWKLENDEEFQMAGLAGHLARNGIDCPACKFRYDLARGGCMHFKCGQCGHEFCSGCSNPFKNGNECNVSASCAAKGLHAHHPRDCLFYLRDWPPERLQQLLIDNGVDYNARARGLPVQDDESHDDVEGAGAAGKCKVMLQREPGIEDAECGVDCLPGHDGLCKNHYVEYLVDLVNRNGIDPADKMELDELAVVFLRAEIPTPRRVSTEDDQLYKERLVQVLKQQIPLPRPPGPNAVGDEVQGEAVNEEELLF